MSTSVEDRAKDAAMGVEDAEGVLLPSFVWSSASTMVAVIVMDVSTGPARFVIAVVDSKRKHNH